MSNVLGELNRSLAKLYGSYGSEGRPSITPEQLLSARLLQLFYGIRSERQLMEQLDYNLMYRWFVGFSLELVVGPRTTAARRGGEIQAPSPAIIKQRSYRRPNSCGIVKVPCF